MNFDRPALADHLAAQIDGLGTLKAVLQLPNGSGQSDLPAFLDAARLAAQPAQVSLSGKVGPGTPASPVGVQDGQKANAIRYELLSGTQKDS